MQPLPRMHAVVAVVGTVQRRAAELDRDDGRRASHLPGAPHHVAFHETRWRLALLGVLLTLLGACTQAGTHTSIPLANGRSALPNRADSARATFFLAFSPTANTYLPQFVHLWFDDGSDERYVPGEVLALDRMHHRYLADGGRHPVAVSGRLQVRVLVTRSSSLADTAGATSLSLALRPDWLWQVGVRIAEDDGSRRGAMTFSDSSVSVPLRGQDGRLSGDRLFLSAVGASLSRPVNPR